jgi:hypothetical protein
LGLGEEVNVPKNLEGFYEMSSSLPDESTFMHVDAQGCAAGCELMLVEVGLQTGFDDVQG